MNHAHEYTFLIIVHLFALSYLCTFKRVQNGLKFEAKTRQCLAKSKANLVKKC
jgi:hypothetical protein